MRIGYWTKAAWFALLGRDYPPEPTVERKKPFRVPNLGYNPLYGPSNSGEKTHIVRQAGRGQTYLCGTMIPQSLQVMSTSPPDPSRICRTCIALLDAGVQ